MPDSSMRTHVSFTPHLNRNYVNYRAVLNGRAVEDLTYLGADRDTLSACQVKSLIRVSARYILDDDYEEDYYDEDDEDDSWYADS